MRVRERGAASCGAAFCMVNTSWNTQGVWTEPGVRFDLRFEYIDQDQPMAGDSKVGVGEISQHHDEVRTINRNWLATVDYAFNAEWGVSATLPLIDRDHTHIHNHRGAKLTESWSFRELGDVRVLGRRQWHERERAGRADGFLRRELRSQAAHGQARLEQRRRRGRRAQPAAGNGHHGPAARRLLHAHARLGIVVVRRCAGPGAARRARRTPAWHAGFARHGLPARA